MALKRRFPEKIEKEKIGGVFAIGGENIIKHYGKGYLLKSPVGIRIRLGKGNFVREVAHDFGILRKYMSPYLPRVKVFVSKDKKHFDILQEFVKGSILKKEDLLYPLIKRQFEDLVRRNERMEKTEGISWDFFGALSLFLGRKDRVGNIVVRKDKTLTLIDIGTMRMKRRNQHPLVYLIIKWALWRQKVYLKSLLK